MADRAQAARPSFLHRSQFARDAQPYAGPLGWKKALKRLLLTRAIAKSGASANSCSTAWRPKELGPICAAARTSSTRNGFAPIPRPRRAVRREYNVGERFIVTVIAQLIPAKAIDIALRALTMLPDHVVLWIVGTGEQAEELKALTRQLGIDKRVTFWGLQRNVEPFLQAADCFVLPSRWQEAAGLVILERRRPACRWSPAAPAAYRSISMTTAPASCRAEDAAGLANCLRFLVQRCRASRRMGRRPKRGCANASPSKAACRCY